MDVQALELATQAMNPNSEDARFYRLTKQYLYGSWTDYPNALVDLKTTWFRNHTGASKTALDLANGKVNYNLKFIPETIRKAAERLEAYGVLERCVYGAPAKPFRTYNNHLVTQAKWAITGRCNYKCRHCFLSAPDARFGELSTADCIRIIHELAEAGVHVVTITGGEPLVRTDLLQLLDEFARCDIRILDIATNGALVNDRLLDSLEERGMKPRFFMSFDGVGWHDWLRGIPGAEKQLMEKFELLARRGYYTGSAMTLHRNNVGVLRESINRLASVGVQTAIINRMLDFGEWRKFGRDLTLSQEEIFNAYLDYMPKFYADGMPIWVTLNRMISLEKNSYRYTVQPILQPADCTQTAVCSAAYRNCFINGDGKIAPCISIAGMEGQEKNFADLSQMSVSDALERSVYSACVGTKVSEYFAANPKCESCRFKRWCRGGCRAQALEFDDSDFLGMDRHRCEFFYRHFTERILKHMAETVPQAECANLPADFPLAPEGEWGEPMPF